MLEKTKGNKIPMFFLPLLLTLNVIFVTQANQGLWGSSSSICRKCNMKRLS